MVNVEDSELTESSDDYIEDYEPLTKAMQFHVGKSAFGKGLFATEDLPAGTELLEELPLVTWPAPAVALAGGFCDACLCVDEALSLCTCGCGARFCSPVCREGWLHRTVACGGGLLALRRWQIAASRESQYGAESVARCNARIAADIAHFHALGLPAGAALQNALRPIARLCAFPPECELDLGGASADELVLALRTHTHAGLCAALSAHLPAAEAAHLAEELCSAPHVVGLLQRLLLNTLQIADGPPPPPPHVAAEAAEAAGLGERRSAHRFAGVFLLTACANHSCAPNVCVTRGDGGSLRLFTSCSVPRGAELHISYVDTALPRAERQRLLAHWTMTCACERCVDEAAAEGAAVPEDKVSGGKKRQRR
jgi:hypothetical protein